ncbi:MAG: thioredoxin family protein [Gemmataceae bacterium]|nr:thioredoxin family protein [Gemmataceae bacterium]
MIRGFIVLLCLAATVTAGQFNKALSIGDAAPAWADLPGVDGKKHSLAGLKDKSVVVVFFTCNSCPAAVAYEDRIIALVKKHGENRGKVAFVGINVNTVEADRLDKMIDRAKARGFNFPYLYDESQKIARDYGASYTPEFFVLGPDRRVAYMGAMDDKSPPVGATKNFLDDAIEATLAGRKPEVPESLARGCMIRFARTKR